MLQTKQIANVLKYIYENLMDKRQGKTSPDELPDSPTKVSKLLNIFSYLPHSSFRIESLITAILLQRYLVSFVGGGEWLIRINRA